MAIFTNLTTTGIDSDWLFPGVYNGDFEVVTHTPSRFSIRYVDGPAAGKVVSFVSTTNDFAYDGNNLPTDGTFATIELWSGNSIGSIKIATWDGLVPAPLIVFDTSNLADVLLAGDDGIIGGGGNDILYGHGGRDVINGNAGDDIFILEAGAVIGPGQGNQYSHVNGGAGHDTLKTLGSADLSLSYMLQIDALIFAGSTTSEVKFSGRELSPALSANFKITGDQHTNTVTVAAFDGVAIEADLSGFKFANWSASDKIKLIGHSKNDTLIGSKLGDILKGGAGKDTLAGGLGKDVLTGNAGPDIFDFNSIKESKPGSASRDTITDFKRGHGDKINLKDIDAKTGVNGNNKFEFIGKDKFSGEKGELRYKDLGAEVIVQGDVTGNGKADFEILVKTGSLIAEDFLL